MLFIINSLCVVNFFLSTFSPFLAFSAFSMPGSKYVRVRPYVDNDYDDVEEKDSENESVESDESEGELEEVQSDGLKALPKRVSKRTEKRVSQKHRREKRGEQSWLDRLERGQEWHVRDTSPPPWLRPQNVLTQSSSHQETSASSQTKTDNIGGIRWDIRPFPQGIPTSKLWTEWCRFKSNFDIATDLNNVSANKRAKLLYLLMGDQLQGLINAAKLCPSFDDPQCYPTLTQNIGTYLRSLVDTTAEHEEFTRLKQEPGESVVTFYARVVGKAGMCGYGNDENRFIRSQILQGMSNRDVANAARTYNHDTQTIVQAATRAEAFNINAGPSKPEARSEDIMHVASTPRYQQAGQKRTSSSGWNSEDRSRANGPPNKRKDYQGRFVGKHNRCFRCDRPKHNGKPCPALYRNCNTCNERGHFSVTCRKKRLNNLGFSREVEEPVKDEQV